MGHDPIKYALWIGGFGLAVTLACGVYIAWINGSSRNLSLGLGALVGACVIFVLQILFELKGSRTSSDFAVEFVVDYQQREVRSPRSYDQSMTVASSYKNLFVEAEVSKIFAVANPPFTNDEAPKIARDLGIVSVISYLLDEQSDWQLDTRSFKTSLGTATQWTRLSTPKECSLITVGSIKEKLQAAGNIFASARIGLMGDQASLCLPPHAVLDVTPNSVAIRSRVCSVIFELQEPFSGMTSIDPSAVATARAAKQWIYAKVEKLPDGSPRFKTVTIAARTTLEFAALRAQDGDLDKYQKWSNRVTEGVKARFDWPG